MGYKEGQVFYKFNEKTGDTEEYKIEGILFKLNRKVKGKQNFEACELDDLLNSGFFTKNKDDVKKEAIRQLEKRFNIKLKEEK